MLRARRSVDAERPAGGHAGNRGNGPSKARADRFLPAACGQRPAGSQRGTGPVDGHGAVATAVSFPGKTKNQMNKSPRGPRVVLSGCV